MSYRAVSDPYCYPGTTVLKNVPGLRTRTELDAFEAIITAQRADEPLPGGRLSVTHYRTVHRHLFQDIFRWAGSYRRIRISKNGSAFCYPEHIEREMRSLFENLKQQRQLRGLPKDIFAEAAAEFLSTLNAIHPFREGNGRTQTIFLFILAEHAGHPLDLNKLRNRPFLAAMISSFAGDDRPLVREIRRLTD